MKLVIVVVLVAACAVMVCGVPYDTYCSGVNEVFSTCGSACPATCDSWRLGGSQWCGRSCNRGCFCRSGYVRNSLGVCIEPAQCTRTSVQVQQTVANSINYAPFAGYGAGLYGYGYGYDNLLGW
ncbi:cysteine-rich venom protein 6-like [Sabethes cyaneus]|uniref:cysteine-rich venom protein 6-like n=1 Tax=Sabethes cyaneus TaxID=53552 RepID=UPI00237D8F8B|nr:cysteine-rich venom protein 6-like [Sabethes cyaneus]